MKINIGRWISILLKSGSLILNGLMKNFGKKQFELVEITLIFKFDIPDPKQNFGILQGQGH